MHDFISLHDAVNLSAGGHTISIEWYTDTGNPIDLNSSSALTITVYNPLAGGAAPVATQQIYTTNSTSYADISTFSNVYSVVPDLSTTVTLASAQTVAVSSILDIENVRPNLDYLGAAIFVDGVQVANTQYTALDVPGSYAAESSVPLSDVISLSAGQHTIAVEWLSYNSGHLVVLPASSLTITAYNPLPGGAAPVKFQQLAATSGSTTSTSYSVVPGLSTSVSLASAQTVDISSILNVYNTGGLNYLLADVFVDGSQLANGVEIFLPTYGTDSSKGDFAAPLHDVLNLSAGVHTIQVEWFSAYGYTIGLSYNNNGLPGSSSLTVITYAPAPVVPASSANLPGDATTLTINGSGFDTNPANDSVAFNLGVVGTVGTTTTPIAGATSASYSAAPTSTTTYWVQIIDAANDKANSSSAKITVNPAMIISTQPAKATIVLGHSDTLSVAVSNGTAPYTYQWYIGSSGVTTTPITGATSSTYLATPTSTTKYWVQITDATLATINSSSAVITVN